MHDYQKLTTTIGFAQIRTSTKAQYALPAVKKVQVVLIEIFKKPNKFVNV